MEDLLHSNLKANCELSLPVGLKELMSDISREVLRAQPQNIYQFIANYLEALLEVREDLTITGRICNDVEKCVCKLDLYSELKNIGLLEEDVKKAVKIIYEHIESGPVNEQSLFLKLLRKTSIDDTQLTAMQEAIQRAFKKKEVSEIFSKEKSEDAQKAAYNTLRLHIQEKQKTEKVAPTYKPNKPSVSATSLAGSHIDLPMYRPYCPHDHNSLQIITEKVRNTDSEKEIEIEKASIDYTSKSMNIYMTQPQDFSNNSRVNKSVVINLNHIVSNDDTSIHCDLNDDESDDVETQDEVSEGENKINMDDIEEVINQTQENQESEAESVHSYEQNNYDVNNDSDSL